MEGSIDQSDKKVKEGGLFASGSYRPVSLPNTLGKLPQSVIACGSIYWAENNHILLKASLVADRTGVADLDPCDQQSLDQEHSGESRRLRFEERD